jgi:photosystem II stability/assembly factor-like uncharacterized protein
MRPLALLLLLTSAAPAQWTLQQSGTTADLRGIHAVSPQIAWASGSHGTVLHTTDGGQHWLLCPTPPNAANLDFRGIQAFDAQTAIVMSSGKGDLSRLYKTTDACKSWKLVFTNPDKEGFWDAVMYVEDFDTTFILGDPVAGEFRLFSQSGEDAKFSTNWNGHPILAAQGQAAFAASNSSVIYNVGEGMFSFITGGSHSEIIHEEHGIDQKRGMFSDWSRSALPFAAGESSGAFSIASSPYNKNTETKYVVVVGGDYKRPDLQNQTAAVSSDWGYQWTAAITPPHGYRSSVAYNPATKSWITVGPNGTDISTDDGRNWTPIQPRPGEAADSARNWNALSLPFVVGPHGRIGLWTPSPK